MGARGWGRLQPGTPCTVSNEGPTHGPEHLALQAYTLQRVHLVHHLVQHRIEVPSVVGWRDERRAND